MAFTLDDLKTQIDACPIGGAIGVPYNLYAELFQPGEPDEGARERAYKFAKANGCAINNKWTGEIVFFVKLDLIQIVATAASKLSGTS